jgi:hypothetical protein
VALDRDSQAVKLVEPNFLHCPGHSIGEDYGLADKLGLGLLELDEDRGRTGHRSWHEVLPQLELERRCLYSKGAQVVAGARQLGVNRPWNDRPGAAPDSDVEPDACSDADVNPDA